MKQIQRSPDALQSLFVKAKGYAREAIPENTRRAYAADWHGFLLWCTEYGRSPLPAHEQTIVLYLTDLAETHKISSLRRKTAAISVAHQLASFASPTRSADVRLALRGIARSQAADGHSRRQATPLLVEDVIAMARACNDDLRGKRDAALILVGFAGGFRRSELVSLRFEDLQRTPEGILLRLRRSKTDQTGEGAEKAIFFGRTPSRCPVLRLESWTVAAGIEHGPLFPRIRKGGRVTDTALTPQSVTNILRERAEQAGIEPQRISGHSLRAGFVTQALISGADYPSIARQTGHRGMQTIMQYDRGRSRFAGNAAQNLGL